MIPFLGFKPGSRCTLETPLPFKPIVEISLWETPNVRMSGTRLSLRPRPSFLPKVISLTFQRGYWPSLHPKQAKEIFLHCLDLLGPTWQPQLLFTSSFFVPFFVHFSVSQKGHSVSCIILATSDNYFRALKGFSFPYQRSSHQVCCALGFPASSICIAYFKVRHLLLCFHVFYSRFYHVDV